MIDPITCVGLATSAFNAIKHGISVGRDLQDMTQQLSQWGQAFSDFNYADEKSKNPPIWKTLVSSKHDNTAIEIFAHRQKMKEMREQIRQHISFVYGPAAWDEVLAIEAAMRKQRKEEAYRKQELQETIVSWILAILAFFASTTLVIVFIYLVGKNQGKW